MAKEHSRNISNYFCQWMQTCSDTEERSDTSKHRFETEAHDSGFPSDTSFIPRRGSNASARKGRRERRGGTRHPEQGPPRAPTPDSADSGRPSEGRPDVSAPTPPLCTPLSSSAPSGSQTGANADLLPERGTHSKHRAWGPLKHCAFVSPEKPQYPGCPRHLELSRNPGGAGRAMPDVGTRSVPYSLLPAAEGSHLHAVAPRDRPGPPLLPVPSSLLLGTPFTWGPSALRAVVTISVALCTGISLHLESIASPKRGCLSLCSGPLHGSFQNKHASPEVFSFLLPCCVPTRCSRSHAHPALPAALIGAAVYEATRVQQK